MKSISIRNVPDDVYRGLQAMAVESRRSLQEQVKLILELEVRLKRGSPVAAAAAWRRKLGKKPHSDTVALVREDRSR